MGLLQADVVVCFEFVFKVCMFLFVVDEVVGEEGERLADAPRRDGRRLAEQGAHRRRVTLAVVPGNDALFAQVRLIPNCKV